MSVLAEPSAPLPLPRPLHSSAPPSAAQDAGEARRGQRPLADWLARQAPAALRRRDLRPEQRRALHAIRRCRTPALGGQRYRCAHCGEEHLGFHSCHHRACPRCGGAKTEAWTQSQVGRLLPVPYFFVTCTVDGGQCRCAHAQRYMQEGAVSLPRFGGQRNARVDA